MLDPDYVVNGDIADVVMAAAGGQLSRWSRFSVQPVATMDPTRRLARMQPEETEQIGELTRRKFGSHPRVEDQEALLGAQLDVAIA